MKWLLVCLLAGVAASQTTFRADVRLVGVSVAVRDGRGSLIGDLTQDDFEVFDDGVPQKLVVFRAQQRRAAEPGAAGGYQRQPGRVRAARTSAT